MKPYHDLLEKIYHDGVGKDDRTGTGTKSLFGEQMKFNLAIGFPLLSTKYTNFHAILIELLWFLKGSTDLTFLHQNNVHIWDDWADENGNLGPIYGKQWRSWPTGDTKPTIDQIGKVQTALRINPYSRRHIVTAWNPAEVEDMALPPCHAFFQFNVRPSEGDGSPKYLDCHLYQRSADMFLGVPFNIASYALLTHMLAQTTALVPGWLTMSFGDVHIYNNHVEQVDQLLRRGYLYESVPKRPRLIVNREIKDIDDFTYEDIELRGYEPLPAIKAPIAV